MFSPTLSFLQRVVSPLVTGFDMMTIKVSASPASVHRLSLAYANGHNPVPSAILKCVRPEWPGDHYGHDRERRFYAHFLPHLAIGHPSVYYVGIDSDTNYRVIVMEDVGGHYRFPPPTHAWTVAELRCLLRTYARLHAQGGELLPPPAERAWMWSWHNTHWTADSLVQIVDDLAAQGVWPSLPAFRRLVEEYCTSIGPMGDAPVTLVHNDVYPPNGGLPVDLENEAVLVDWEMAGWGMAELDLAYLFTQPYRSASRVDRAELLAYYWDQRQAIEGRRPPPAECAARQRFADILLAFSLVPVAYRVAAAPFPEGSAPAHYWNSMFGVLHDRLNELTQTAAAY